ncbi:GNAT family N-acetyltransferase [Proteiniborus sp. MB09-C3]|uniref:GNAT family N-acetyltransferase n=1 Tax=Proteiniborus sp. MB09-C3 TaxID=3050072 RepID=UPI002556E714|nr:GNAT family N-acetyltransferase [Proteiniborus sp. MB09-C3]WIV12756.1 GNAT family N-acetyltransferase [Proteiniborus sp. MB09-C3]
MNVFTRNIKDIQPSQLYISKTKLSKVEEYLDSVDIADIDPLPIKKIGKNIFFTDGHTRAFALMKKGIEEVKVYWDEDDLDWLQYLICINWCNKKEIKTIRDLRDRVVDDEDYQKLWNARCDSMQKRTMNNLDYYIDIRTISEGTEKSDICELVLRALPTWFGIEEAIKEYINGVKDKAFLSAYIGDVPVGFLSIKDHNEFTSEIYVVGILKELHGRGMGKRLVKAAEDILINQNKKFLTVKTLGSSHPDEGYKKTRKFYRAVGFYPLEEFTEIWGKENPCLLMVKNI